MIGHQISQKVPQLCALLGRNLVRRIWFWVLVQSLFLFVVYYALGNLDLRGESDSKNYLDMSLFGSLHAWLSSSRTSGYPLFLKVVSAVSPDFSFLPYIQFGLHVLAVLVFGRALREYGFSVQQSLIAASPLLYIEAFRQHVGVLLTDGLAGSAAVLTISLLLMVLARGGRVRYLGLALALFLTYQIRPVYLFLILLLPLLGTLLRWYHDRGFDWRRNMGLVTGLFASSIVPYLVFSCLRWATVGDFGLVAAGGWDHMGIAGQMLTSSIVDDLPEDQQPLAKAILAKRRRYQEAASNGGKMEDLPEDLRPLAKAILEKRLNYQDVVTKNNKPDLDRFFWVNDAGSRKLSIECADPLLPGNAFSYTTWYECFSYTCNVMALQTTADMYGTSITSPDYIMLNTRLKDLARSIILENPTLYFRWISKAFLKGAKQELTKDEPILLLFYTMILACDVVFLSIFPFRDWGDGKRYLWLPDNLDNWARLFWVMSAIGVSIFVVGLLTVVLVEVPMMRYVWPVSIFIPSILAVLLVWKWLWVLRYGSRCPKWARD